METPDAMAEIVCALLRMPAASAELARALIWLGQCLRSSAEPIDLVTPPYALDDCDPSLRVEGEAEQAKRLNEFSELGGDVNGLLEGCWRLTEPFRAEFDAAGIALCAHDVRRIVNNLQSRHAAEGTFPTDLDLNLIRLARDTLPAAEAHICVAPLTTRRRQDVASGSSVALAQQIPAAGPSLLRDRERGQRPLVTESTHLKRVRKYLVPALVVLVSRDHLEPLRPALAAREYPLVSQSLGYSGGARGRQEFEAKLRRSVSAEANHLTLRIVKLLYPHWARDLDSKGVRNALKNAARRQRSRG